MLARWALPMRQLGILLKRFRNAFIQTSLRFWGRDAKMLSMFQAGFDPTSWKLQEIVFRRV